jgi:outer membrane lipopolysaccharide assembly protein LptE/RlpB
MIHFKKIAFVATVAMLTGCATNLASNKEIGSSVVTTSWENLVTMINTGDYQSVGQQHDRTVRLVLENGQVFQAKEPKIDDVSKVVRNCVKCSGKPFLTE